MNDSFDTVSQSLASAAKASGRRRFLGAGAGVAPVVLTLASQPALATTCFTPSRALSANMSVVFGNQQAAAGQNFSCSGKGSVKSYRENPSTWPATVTRSTARFSHFFTGPGTSTDLLTTILTNSPGSLEASFIAALFNIRGGAASSIPAAVLDESKLKAIWTEFKTKGFYQLYAGGPQWNAVALQLYLRNNFIIGTLT
ncbi:MAG: hypothetical protein ACK5O3_02220 [Burkholderiales bacterium]|jgi:hypothetical protein